MYVCESSKFYLLFNLHELLPPNLGIKQDEQSWDNIEMASPHSEDKILRELLR